MPYPAQVQEDVVESADVCVIGSGAAGAIIASELARAGKNVVLLEKGGYYYTEDMNEREVDMMSMLWKNAGAVFTEDFGMAIAQGQCLGGSTVINDAVCFDTPPSVLQEWRRSGVRIDGDLWDKARQAVRTAINVQRIPEAAVNANNRVLRDICACKHYDGVLNERNCTDCKECGFCHLGCHYGTKNDMLSTYIHDALKESYKIRIYCNCAADRVTYKGPVADVVNGAFVDREGRRRFKIRVNARVIVVSAGAIASPVLLLKSNIALDRTGRGMSFHPSSFLLGMFPEKKINGFEGIPMAYSCTHFSVLKGCERGGFMIESIFPPLFQLALGIPPKYTHDYGSRFPKKIENLAMAGVMARDWEPRGSVCLTEKGSAKVRYAFSDSADDVKTLAQGLKTLAELWFDAGACYVITGHNDLPKLRNRNDILRLAALVESNPGGLQLASAHPQGGSRMGEDASKCVVDSNCKVHGFDNLFVCDASVFPTAVGVNPQITVMTLAKLTADHILANWAGFAVPAPADNIPGRTCSARQPVFCSAEALKAVFHRLDSTLPPQVLVNVDKTVPHDDPRRWSFDRTTQTIYNNERWLGFFPPDGEENLQWKQEKAVLAAAGVRGYNVQRIVGRFWKQFYNNNNNDDGGSSGRVRGTVGTAFMPFKLLAKILHWLRIPSLGFDAYSTEDPRYGHVIKLDYDLRRLPGVRVAADLLKMVDADTAIGMFEGKVITPSIPAMQFFFALCRRYPVEFMTEGDHDRLFALSGEAPAEKARGRWRVKLISDQMPDVFNDIAIEIDRRGRPEPGPLFQQRIGRLLATARLDFDRSAWDPVLRLINNDLMVCQWVLPLLDKEYGRNKLLGVSNMADGTRYYYYYLRFMLQREGRSCA
jgi:choline dehydrogenase-like flavoprotein